MELLWALREWDEKIWIRIMRNIITILNIHVLYFIIWCSPHFPLFLQRGDLHANIFIFYNYLQFWIRFKYYEDNTSYKNKTSQVNRDVWTIFEETVSNEKFEKSSNLNNWNRSSPYKTRAQYLSFTFKIVFIFPH